MTDQLFLRSSQSSIAPASAPNPNRVVIQVNWMGGVAKAIKILHHRIAMESTARVIQLNPGCGQGHNAQFALDARDPVILPAGQRRSEC